MASFNIKQIKKIFSKEAAYFKKTFLRGTGLIILILIILAAIPITNTVRQTAQKKTTLPLFHIADVTWDQTNSTQSCKGKDYPKVTWSCNGNKEHSTTNHIYSDCSPNNKEDDHTCPSGYTCKPKTNPDGVQCVSDASAPVNQQNNGGCGVGEILTSFGSCRSADWQCSQDKTYMEDVNNYQSSGGAGSNSHPRINCGSGTECRTNSDGAACYSISPGQGNPPATTNPGGNTGSTCDGYSCNKAINQYSGRILKIDTYVSSDIACHQECLNYQNNECRGWDHSGNYCTLYTGDALKLVDKSGSTAFLLSSNQTAPKPQAATTGSPGAGPGQTGGSRDACATAYPGTYNPSTMGCGNYQDGDIAGAQKTGVNDPLTCQTYCGTVANCVAWTYFAPKNTCYVKSSTPNPFSTCNGADCVSGRNGGGYYGGGQNNTGNNTGGGHPVAPPSACQCTGGGIIVNGQANSNYTGACGQTYCGMDGQYWICNDSHWTAQGGVCGGGQSAGGGGYCPTDANHLSCGNTCYCIGTSGQGCDGGLSGSACANSGGWTCDNGTPRCANQ